MLSSACTGRIKQKNSETAENKVVGRAKIGSEPFRSTPPGPQATTKPTLITMLNP